MKVSIIVPAYNAAETIAETLDSLCRQSFQDWEAIVVDDGSTDETADIATDFVKRDGRIRLVRQAHLGGCAARNKGIELAHFDWVLFLDADDLLLPGHLERMMNELASDPDLDAIHCAWVRTTSGGEPLDEERCHQEGDLFALSACRPLFPPLACIIRRSLVEAVGNFDTSFRTCQDWDLWQRVARTGARFGVIPEVLGYYRATLDSVSTRTPFQTLKDGLQVINHGHSFDPRVPAPDPAHINGLSEESLSGARLGWACWPAGLILSRGEDARPLLEALREDRYPALNPFNVAHTIFRAVPIGRCQTFDIWVDLWPHLEQRIDDFLLALEAKSGATGLAWCALAILERLILENVASPRPLTIGATHAVQIEVTAPIPDVVPPPDTKRLRCEVLLEGNALGVVELPIIAEVVQATAIADAIATVYAWPILGRFFEHSLYPFLRLERTPAGLALWRDSLCLIEKLSDSADSLWTTLHDQVGWVLFLQELWARFQWPNEVFYDSSYVEAPAVFVHAADSPLIVETCQEIPDVVTPYQRLEVILTIAGVNLGTALVPVSAGTLRAHEIRVAITEFGGFNLCRLAVREGLLGTPLNDPIPLRARLAMAAAKHRLAEEAAATE